MGCANIHAAAQSLQQQHEEQATKAIRPPYLKPASDQFGLSDAQFELATRVFIHFDEVSLDVHTREQVRHSEEWQQVRD